MKGWVDPATVELRRQRLEDDCGGDVRVPPSRWLPPNAGDYCFTRANETILAGILMSYATDREVLAAIVAKEERREDVS